MGLWARSLDLLKAGIGAISKRLPSKIASDPDVVRYAAAGFGLGSLVRLACHRVPVCLPAGLLVLRGALRIPLPARALSDAQWPGPLPAPEEQIGFMALVAPPQCYGLCPDHGRHHPPARVSRASSSWPTTRPSPCSSWSSRRCGSGWPGRQ